MPNIYFSEVDIEMPTMYLQCGEGLYPNMLLIVYLCT